MLNLLVHLHSCGSQRWNRASVGVRRSTIERSYRIPGTTVYVTHPSGGFPSSIARQPRRCQYRMIRLRSGLGEMFPTPTLFQLWRYRPRRIGPEGCDVQRRIRYRSTDGPPQPLNQPLHQPLQLNGHPISLNPIIVINFSIFATTIHIVRYVHILRSIAW